MVFKPFAYTSAKLLHVYQAFCQISSDLPVKYWCQNKNKCFSDAVKFMLWGILLLDLC